MSILIVDDSASQRLVLRKILLSSGFSNVVDVESAIEALKYLRLDRPEELTDVDLIVMDYMMPEMDGLEASYIIKQSPKGRDVPIIMVTGASQEDGLEKAFSAGVGDYIVKPVKRVELLARVKSLLQLKQEMDRRKERERELMWQIEERRRTEQALLESETKYRALVEELPEGLIQTDETGKLMFYNPGFARILKSEDEDLAGRPIMDFMDEANQSQYLRRLQRGPLESDSPYELTFTTKNGQKAKTIVSPKPNILPNGKYEGGYALVTDITEYARLEAQLLQARKLEAIGNLAAGIAHEINTPAQYVSVNAMFLQRGVHNLIATLVKGQRLAEAVKSGHPARDLALDLEQELDNIKFDFLMDELPLTIEQSLEGMEHISKIVESIKDFAHPGVKEHVPTDINRSIENTLIISKNEWKYVAEAQTRLTPDLPLVMCIPGQINQALLNIIVNAAQAIAEKIDRESGEKGLITVSTRYADQEVEIRIEDNGPGIDPKIGNNIFDPFFTTKAPGKGTGQGLAISHSIIVNKHGGSISYESKPGQGTVFILRLPYILESDNWLEE